MAVFDTHYRLARLLTGSAADWIARRLASAGAALVVAPESFFVERETPAPGEQRWHDHERLEVGEEERSQTWTSVLDVHEQTPMPA